MLHHRRATRFLHVIIICSLFGLFLVYWQRPQPSYDSPTEWSYPNHGSASANRELSRSKSLVPVSDVGPRVEKDDKTEKVIRKPNVKEAVHPELSSEDSDSAQITSWNLEIGSNVNVTGAKVVDSVNFLNENYGVRNIERFGPTEESKTVIVIQVHNRVNYLSTLIDSLRSARGIEESLLVFSHDINIPEINALIENITFAMTIQIFYPFNMQLFPHVFPGQHEDDCPEKITKEKAKELRCRDWEHPDKYGNYRVAKFTQIKHHWWWKMNYVFDGVISRYGLQESWVLLLEEDHYVAPDFLHVLDSMTSNKEKFCPQCDILCLGIYVKNYNSYSMYFDRLGVAPWYSSKHNMGMAIRSNTWDVIRNCSKVFCDWDDYNWDWSMLQISVQCLPQRWKVMFTKAPRIIHIGDCGVHTHKCLAHNASAAATLFFEKNKEKLFPTEMKVTELSKRMLKPSKANGGWGDLRDRSLCERNTRPLEERKEHEEVLRELYESSVHLTGDGSTRNL